MAIITIEKLTITRKPVLNDIFYNGKTIKQINFGGYEEKQRYNSQETDKKYYVFQLYCNKNNQEMQNDLLQFSEGDVIKIRGDIFGGTEIKISERGASVYYSAITPTQFKLISVADKSTQEEKEMPNDDIPF